MARKRNFWLLIDLILKMKDEDRKNSIWPYIYLEIRGIFCKGIMEA
jgi:hypothetical protein